MKVILLAGGSGERLKSLTKTVSKPMMPINGRPVISYLLDQLAGYEVIIITKDIFVEQYETLKAQYDFSIIGETEQRGTGGAVDLLRNDINETFCVSNADEIKHFNLSDILGVHLRTIKRGGIATLPIKYLKDITDYGSVEFEENSQRIHNFIEKKNSKPGTSGWISIGGPYVFEPEIFNYMPKNTKSMFETDVFPVLTDQKLVYAYKYSGPFHTIDTPEKYQKANKLSPLTSK